MRVSCKNHKSNRKVVTEWKWLGGPMFQSNVKLRMRMAIDWWSMMVAEGGCVVGEWCLIPRFSGGLALDLLYYHVEDVEGYAWAKESLKSGKKRGRYG
ncbi:hypothetical protein E3N88_37660 [Mikania micrantha]|uniref:Uncharacterized protein n=1 Tax=Mikania micrantha TaxID=192012 RepID=A0A5N6LRT3_9ASTR|nr:hypothetical protein E3N88_37660 [Mikania micrantha]